ncbi:MAG: hypothetical protein QMC77_07805 [Methanocellales archaeon]|nr:hypothetical protein [Methanocellales archaeon]
MSYLINLAIVCIGRLLDNLSTLYGTPTLKLESNPFMRKIGWKGHMPLEILLCVVFAFNFYASLFVFIISALAAAGNFAQAWETRTFGEQQVYEAKKQWVRRAEPRTIYSSYILHGIIMVVIGLVIIYLAQSVAMYVVGLALISYALVSTIYQLMAIRKLRKVKWRKLQPCLIYHSGSDTPYYSRHLPYFGS